MAGWPGESNERICPPRRWYECALFRPAGPERGGEPHGADATFSGLDRQFGTIDFLTLLDLQLLPAAAKERFLG